MMDDLISRQAAIDALHMHLMYRMGTDSNKKRLAKQIKNAVRDTTKSARLDRWMSKNGLTGEVDINDL